MVHEHIVNGEVLSLIQPIHIGAVWTQENKIFRSSVWNALGELVSAGFPKFVNMGEKPEVFPPPQSLNGTVIVDKLDGSLLIVSKYKGNYILRTRGTVDASKLDNGAELEVFKTKFLQSLNHDTPDTWNVSILFEWVSPLNKIVLNYGDEPDWFLVGIVNHADYSLHTQDSLDMWARNKGFKRPQTYTFTDVADLLANVDQWKDKEGVCLYSKNGQEIHKIKSSWYLIRHRMKSELSSMEKLMDFWFNNGKPEYLAFKDCVCNFDYELWADVQGNASKIAEGYKEVLKIIAHMKGFVDSIRALPTRKEQAAKVISAYGNTNRAAFLFRLLDGKELNDEDIKKLLFQTLKS